MCAEKYMNFCSFPHGKHHTFSVHFLAEKYMIFLFRVYAENYLPPTGVTLPSFHSRYVTLGR